MSLSVQTIINIAHILFNGPFLIYFGIFRPVDPIFYIILALMAVTIFFVASYRYLQGQMYVWLMLHLLLFATLFMYIAGLYFYYKAPIPDSLFNVCLSIGVVALIYHSTELIRRKFYKVSDKK